MNFGERGLNALDINSVLGTDGVFLKLAASWDLMTTLPMSLSVVNSSNVIFFRDEGATEIICIV